MRNRFSAGTGPHRHARAESMPKPVWNREFMVGGLPEAGMNVKITTNQRLWAPAHRTKSMTEKTSEQEIPRHDDEKEDHGFLSFQ